MNYSQKHLKNTENYAGNNTNNQITKLDENMIYKIKDVEKLQMSFGKKYVLVDDEDNKCWTNNK